MRSGKTRPTLFHASPNGVQGDHLTPGSAKTCVHYQFVGTDQQHLHEGGLIFAGANLASAYAYAFKLHDPVRKEDDAPYCYMANVSVMKMDNRQKIPLAVIADKNDFMELLSHSHPVIYQMPSRHYFEQVRDITKRPMGEWISREAVPLDQCVKIPVTSMDEAMEKGAQFFFLKEGISKDEWYDMMQSARPIMQEQLAPYTNDRETYDKLASKLMMQFMYAMVESGVLEHYNATQDICPVDLAHGVFQPGKEPDLFSTNLGERSGRSRKPDPA